MRQKELPMTSGERRAAVSLLASLIITAGYLAVMLPRVPTADAYSAEVFHFWGMFFMLLIVVSIVLKVIVVIVFSIFNTVITGRNDEKEDERDHLIGLKASRNALGAFTAGFLLAMASLIVGATPTTMFLILLGAGVFSEIVSEGSALYHHRMGV
jgi:uncharacterized membrane protein